MGEMRNAYKISVRKPEGKRQLGRPKCRWEDNIIVDLREVEWDGVDWTHGSGKGPGVDKRQGNS